MAETWCPELTCEPASFGSASPSPHPLKSKVRTQGLRSGRLFRDGRDGGRNGSFLLDSGTVFDDAAVDELIGAAGADWYFARTTGVTPDRLRDRNPAELLTEPSRSRSERVGHPQDRTAVEPSGTMPATFDRTLRALEVDHPRRQVVALLVGIGGSLWAG
jgi:hypothetical protein